MSGPGPFGGESYDPLLDGERLRAQLARVRLMMSAGTWWTLGALEAATGCPQASISARLRDLRKRKFGWFVVEKRRVQDQRGLWEYRVAGQRQEAA